MADAKSKVTELLKAVGSGDMQPFGVIHPSRYVQHNLGLGDGLSGLMSALQGLEPGSVQIRPVRVFRDGNFVFAHTDSDFFGPRTGFEIFRFEDGMIVEHWDNGQETAGPNSSGHGMSDGPVQTSGLGDTAANKALVRRFVDDILVARRMDRLSTYFDGDRYVQHNPHIGDGVASLAAALGSFPIAYDHVHMVLGEGNFVLVVSEGRLSDQPTAFYDLFRVENDRIAEHWDTLETIPPRDQWKNANGKF